MNIVNDSNFKEEVLNADGVVLVDFFAEWCGPCRQMLPIVDELSSTMTGVKIVKVDVDDAPQTPSLYDVQTIPTFAIFKNGELVDKKVGSMAKGQFEDWIKSHL